ncbi:MAG: hypothetical protein J6V12_00550 [Bacteroidaceae bacterium]|nr:hypothetical protein [Bacteroidaceae bacterium]
MLIFVVYKEDEQEQQFAATLVYEDGARCYVGSSLSADLLLKLCPMLEEWQKVKGSDVPEGWLYQDMGAQTKLFVNKRIEESFLELTSSFDSPMDFARNWDEVAKNITKRMNAHLNLRQRLVQRCKRLVRDFKRRYKIISDLWMYDIHKDDWP